MFDNITKITTNLILKKKNITILKQKTKLKEIPIKIKNLIFKLNKALYGLKQASRTWYERLSKFLLKNIFLREKINTTLFIKRKNEEILVIQIYIDGIIFGSTNQDLC